jgi:polyisoprenyl-phosphate glycosyltransferase
MKISVVVPVYGCATCLAELCARLRATLEKLTDDHEIILVNDASPDDAWHQIRHLCVREPRVKGINLSRNFGQHYAITAGLDRTNGDWVVVMDCDLQDRPEDIARLYTKAAEGYDIVYGVDADSRAGRSANLTSRMYYWVHRRLTREESFNPSFVIMSRAVVSALRQFRERHRLILKLIQSVGFRRTGVAVQHDVRTQGQSAYDFRKRVRLAFFGLVSSTTRLLRVAIVCGVISSVTSLAFGAYVLINKLIYIHYAAGWSSLIVSIFFVGGVIMVLLGIIGAYLEVIYDEVKQRPIYIVSETTNFEGT